MSSGRATRQPSEQHRSDLQPQSDRRAPFAVGALIVILPPADLFEAFPCVELQRGLIVVGHLQKDEPGAAALEIFEMLFKNAPAQSRAASARDRRRK